MTETYTLAESGVIRASDGASIPADDGNRDWAAYLEWVATGGVANPEPAPMVDPNVALEAAALASAQGKIAATARLTATETAAAFPALA